MWLSIKWPGSLLLLFLSSWCLLTLLFLLLNVCLRDVSNLIEEDEETKKNWSRKSVFELNENGRKMGKMCQARKRIGRVSVDSKNGGKYLFMLTFDIELNIVQLWRCGCCIFFDPGWVSAILRCPFRLVFLCKTHTKYFIERRTILYLRAVKSLSTNCSAGKAERNGKLFSVPHLPLGFWELETKQKA